MKKTLFLLILFSGFVLTSFAQSYFTKGYYIGLDNDTVRGFLNFDSDRMNAETCVFKESLEDKTTIEFSPREIKSYRFEKENKFYISKEINVNNTNKLIFAEFLVDGMMSLFYYKDKKQDYYFFENEDGEVTEITTKREYFDGSKLKRDNDYVNKLNYTFRKYPEMGLLIRSEGSYVKLNGSQVHTEGKTIDFNRANFIMLVQEYHKKSCTTDDPCIVFTSDYNKSYARISISPYIGIQHIEYKWESVNNTTSKKYYPTLGVEVKLSLPRIVRRMSLLVDGAVSKISDQFSYKAGNQSFNIEHSSFLIQPKIGIEYQHTVAKWQPFIQAGFASAFILNSSTNNLLGQYDDRDEWVVIPSPNKDHKPASSFTGWFASAGVAYELPNKKSVFIKASYENLSSKDKLTIMQLKAGYVF